MNIEKSLLGILVDHPPMVFADLFTEFANHTGETRARFQKVLAQAKAAGHVETDKFGKLVISELGLSQIAITDSPPPETGEGEPEPEPSMEPSGSELPGELVNQLRKNNPKNSAKRQTLIRIMKANGKPMTIDDLLIAYWKETGEILQRHIMTNRAWYAEKCGDIEKAAEATRHFPIYQLPGTKTSRQTR